MSVQRQNLRQELASAPWIEFDYVGEGRERFAAGRGLELYADGRGSAACKRGGLLWRPRQRTIHPEAFAYSPRETITMTSNACVR
jgi:hypothetical protein